MANHKRNFKKGQKIRCSRAPIFEVLEDSYKDVGIVVSMPVAVISKEITTPNDSVSEMLGGIFEVEIESFPTFEIPMHTKTREELMKVISQFSSADKLLSAFRTNPELFGDFRYQIIPAKKEEHVGKKLYVAGDSLIELILN
jgi:hypothetical protein